MKSKDPFHVFDGLCFVWCVASVQRRYGASLVHENFNAQRQAMRANVAFLFVFSLLILVRENRNSTGVECVVPSSRSLLLDTYKHRISRLLTVGTCTMSRGESTENIFGSFSRFHSDVRHDRSGT
jgi:hypothetical protein